MDTGGDCSDASCDGLCSDDDCYSAYNGYSSDDGEGTSNDGLHVARNAWDDEELFAIADKKRYAVLTEHEIGRRLSVEAAAMAEAFAVPADWGLALLLHYRWNPYRLEDDWFSEKGRVIDAVGLGDTTVGVVVPSGEEIMACAICTEGNPGAEMASAGCAHYYCHGCWRGYVAAALGGGGVLALRCPDASCSRAVLRGTVERFATGAGRDAYARALARAYVEARGSWFKPCTAAGCGRAMELLAEGAEGDGDLVCGCGNAFCHRCGGAAHWPATCAEMARWAREADEASADWILLNTKPCPACQRPVERLDGCRHMVCAEPCNHAFCWVCLHPTAVCDAAGHGCTDRDQVVAAAAERARAGQALGRFLHYQDLWMASLRKRGDAERQLRWFRDAVARGPAFVHPRDVGFVERAFEQVAEGRRVLGNACAHGQSLRDADTARWKLFEHWRRQANAVLELLQHRAEAAAAAAPHWMKLEEHREELTMTTCTTRRCIESFCKAVVEGLQELRAPAWSC